MKRGALFFSLWVLLLIAGIVYIRRQASPSRQSPEALWPVPSFQMVGVTTTGTSPLRLQDLLGQPWIASFIFTRCGGPCPMISGRMAEFQRTLPSEVRLVSFSVDPDHDTPEVLRHYASRFKADPKRWIFVRGDKAQLYKLLYEGFHLALAEDPSAPAGFRITHSTKLALVDAKGRIRHFYDSNAESLSEQIRQDLTQLEKTAI